MKAKIYIALIIIMGSILISYGMIMDNNIVFLAGIILFSAGYILIRKKLKDSIKEMNDPKE